MIKYNSYKSALTFLMTKPTSKLSNHGRSVAIVKPRSIWYKNLKKNAQVSASVFVLLVSPTFSCMVFLFLPALSAYFAKAADRADFMATSGSFFLLLPVFSESITSSWASDAGLTASAAFGTRVSEAMGLIGTTRLNGSWKVSYNRFTYFSKYNSYMYIRMYN